MLIWKKGFKIKTKEDAKLFLECAGTGVTKDHPVSCCGQCLYWCDDELDYCLDVERAEVATRSKEFRGDIFAPYVCDPRESLELIWKTRKQINAQIFSDEV